MRKRERRQSGKRWTLVAGAATVMVVAMAVAMAVGLGGMGVAAASPRPGSKDRVLRYFLKAESNQFLTAAGKPFVPSSTDPPSPGDEQERTDLEYVGNHAHHAKASTASDHQLCIFDSGDDLVCHSQVAIGGSMILAHVTLTDPSTTVTEEVTGGTGSYLGATGTIVYTSAAAGASSGELTITLHHR